MFDEERKATQHESADQLQAQLDQVAQAEKDFMVIFDVSCVIYLFYCLIVNAESSSLIPTLLPCYRLNSTQLNSTQLNSTQHNNTTITPQ
jgi:hypothetical protein